MTDFPCRVLVKLNDEIVAHCKLYEGHGGIHEAHEVRGMHGPAIGRQVAATLEKYVSRKPGRS
jgi:hypothetical protein